MKYKELIEYAKVNKKTEDFEEEAIYFLILEKENINRSTLLLKMNDEVTNIDSLKSLIDDYILKGISPQYLIGYTYFYKYKFFVSKDVLIPRFDTEVLVENAINKIKERYKNKKIKIVDIGTGSGAIAICVKKEVNCEMTAIDISKKALDVALKNSLELKCDIDFRLSDLLNDIEEKFDVIISNPPYIKKGEYVMDIVRRNEPSIALYSEDDGMSHYKRIIDGSLRNLNDDGMIIFEIPDNKCENIVNYAKKYYTNIEIIKDYNNQRRVLVITK